MSKEFKVTIHQEAHYSDCCYISITPSEVGLFKYLLEGYDNLALFTVLDKHQAVLKVFFSPHQKKEALATLQDIQTTINFQFLE